MDIDLDAHPAQREESGTKTNILTLNSYDEWSQLKEVIVGSPVALSTAKCNIL